MTESDGKSSSFTQKVCQKDNADADQGSALDKAMEESVAFKQRSFTAPWGTTYLQPNLPANELEHELTHAVQDYLIGSAQYSARGVAEQLYNEASKLPHLGGMNPYHLQGALENSARETAAQCANSICPFNFTKVNNAVSRLHFSGTFTWE